MSSSRDLLPAFHVEVGEQLDSLELALINQEASGNVDVNQLFRDFHTIKSSSAMFEFSSMEKIAHASEDYLDLIRKGSATLDTAAVDILLEAVDCLKKQLMETQVTPQNPTQNASLLQKLQMLSVHEKTVSAQSDTAKNHDLAVINMLTGEVGKLSDAEAVQFAKACSHAMRLIMSVDSDPKVVRTEIMKLQNLANLVGFSGIKKQLQVLSKSSKEGQLFSNGNTRILADLFGRIQYFEQRFGVDCGVDQCVASCLHIYGERFDDNTRALQAVIMQLHNMLVEYRTGEVSELCEQCIMHIEDIVMYAQLFRFSTVVKVLRFCLQLFREIGRDNIVISADLHAATDVITAFVHKLGGMRAETNELAAAMALDFADIKHHIANTILTAEGREAIDFIKQKLAISPAQIRTLSVAALQMMVDAINDDALICDIEVDVENASGVGEALLNWMVKSGRIINSRTVFISAIDEDKQSEKTHVAFLIAFRMNQSAITSALRTIDVDGVYHKLAFYVAETAVAEETKEQAVARDVDMSPEKNLQAQSTTLRIDSKRLDNVVAQIGEIVMLRNMMTHTVDINVANTNINKLLELLRNLSQDITPDRTRQQIGELVAGLADHYLNIQQVDSRIQGLVATLQAEVMELRVVPVSMVFNRIPSMVQKMAHAQGKDIHLVIEGEGVKIDKGMVDILMEPMVHLVRNCIDHGIESPEARSKAGKPSRALLKIAASQHGSSLLIEVSDDGKGLDSQKIINKALERGLVSGDPGLLSGEDIANLIFMPGFSTSDVLTETSGRGVGMDVVKTRITQLGGTIEVQSTSGMGSRFILRLPLSVAIQEVLMVLCNGYPMALPERSVQEVIRLDPVALQKILDNKTYAYGDTLLPVHNLGQLVGKSPAQPDNQPRSAELLVMERGDRVIALLVDDIIAREDIYVRDLHEDLRALPSISGASILGDGSIIFIMDCDYIFSQAKIAGQELHATLS